MNVLIVDDEIEIAEIIDFLIHDKMDKEIETYIANSGNDAIEILKNHKIDLCISDHNMPNGKGNDVLKYILANNLQTYFVLCSTILPKELPEDYLKKHIFFHIQKPAIVEGITSLIIFYNEKFPSKTNTTSTDLYIPISVQLLLLLGKTPFEIYIRISDAKYIKCINANESFLIEDNIKYLNKPLTKLYVKKQDNQEKLVEFVSAAITKLMLKKDVPLNEKMLIAHSQLCGLIKFTGMTEELSLIVKDNIIQSVSIITKNSLLNNFWNRMNLVGEYPSQLYTLHSLLASVIVKKLKWNSEATVFKLTLAAFLQDITLESVTTMKIYDYHHFEEIRETLKKDEIKNFLEHPLKAKDYILSFKEIPPDIDKIILEQHEMPNGSGFPRKLNAGQLGPLSCLFILSGLLARYILNDKEHFNLNDFIKKFEELDYDKGNFKEVFNVIKSM